MLGRKELMSETPDVEWIIEGVLPAAGRVLLYADSGVGKSFTALDIGLHIATGTPWHGHAVTQGTPSTTWPQRTLRRSMGAYRRGRNSTRGSRAGKRRTLSSRTHPSILTLPRSTSQPLA
jgi:hypothetical protein